MDNRQRAEQVYSLLKGYLQRQNLACTDISLGVECVLSGEEFPVTLRASVNADTQRLDIVSVLPFAVRKDRSPEMARVLNYINGAIAGGKFVLDIRNDTVCYVYSAGFADTGSVSEPFVEAAFSLAFYQTDAYFSKLYAVAKGIMSIREFAAN